METQLWTVAWPFFPWKHDSCLEKKKGSPLLLKLLRINPPLPTLSIRLAAGLSRNGHQGCLLAIQAVLENASGKSDLRDSRNPDL